jgi:hypothetical protein
LRKSNKKLYVLSVVPIVAILYFLTATGIQDDSMWDISTNEYYQQGANFELFALTYEECQKWPTNVQQARNCPTSSSSGGSSSTSTEKDYGSIYTPTPTPTTSWWDNIFTPTSSSTTSSSSTSSSTTSTSTVFSCQSNVAMFYKDDERNTWRGYGSTWTEIRGLELTPRDSDKGKIIAIKGDVYMKCDWNGNGSIKLTSATTRTIVTDGFLAGTYSYSGQGSSRGVGINAFTSDMYAEDYDFHLINGHKTKIGEINHITESQLESIENYLSPITYQGGNDHVGITFATTLSPKFVLSNDFGVTKTGITENHISSMLFTSTLQEPEVKISNQRNTPMKIESITNANTYEDLMYVHFEIPYNTLDTGIDVSKSDRQIKIISSMRDYDSREGSPIIKLTHGSEVIKITSIKVEKSGDSQRFVTYFTMPIDSSNGEWTVTIENVNRPDMSSSEKFVINNSTPAPVCDPDKKYQQRDDCYSGPVDVYPDEVTQLEDLRVGVIWKVKDSGGKTLDQGNSLVDGNSIIPQLNELALISEIVDDRSGDTLKFYQIMIQPIIQFDDKSQDINKYRYAQSYNPLNIPITLSIPDDQGAGTKTKYIERTASGTGYYKLLGTGYMSQADADFLADNAGYEVGDRFTVEAKIGGEFTLTSNTNKDYNFVFDDVKITKEFQYGIKGESLNPSEQKQKDDEWNDCLEQIDQSGRYKIPNYDGWNDGFQCQTVDEYDKQQCENNGMIWSTVGIIDYGGYCVEDVGLPPNPSEDELKTAQEKCEDSQSDSGSYTWNVGQEMCIFNPDPISPQPRNGGEDDDVDDVGSSSGNLQLCSPGQSISDCFKDLQIKQSSLINLDDNTIMIIGIIFAVLILVAIIARRRQPSYGGLMSRYG